MGGLSSFPTFLPRSHSLWKQLEPPIPTSPPSLPPSPPPPSLLPFFPSYLVALFGKARRDRAVVDDGVKAGRGEEERREEKT